MKQEVTVFPDLEVEVVQSLRTVLAGIEDESTRGVRVATKFADPQEEPAPTKQVVIASDGGNLLNPLIRSETFRVLVTAEDEETTSTLSQWVEAALKSLRFTDSNVHQVTIEASASRVDNPKTGQELRLITASALTIAQTITI